MPLLFSPTQCGLSDLKAGEVCQKQAEAVPEKPATSRLFNLCKPYKIRPRLRNKFQPIPQPMRGLQLSYINMASSRLRRIGQLLLIISG